MDHLLPASALTSDRLNYRNILHSSIYTTSKPERYQ